jgi:hypothetical protein
VHVVFDRVVEFYITHLIRVSNFLEAFLVQSLLINVLQSMLLFILLIIYELVVLVPDLLRDWVQINLLRAESLEQRRLHPLRILDLWLLTSVFPSLRNAFSLTLPLLL